MGAWPLRLSSQLYRALVVIHITHKHRRGFFLKYGKIYIMQNSPFQPFLESTAHAIKHIHIVVQPAPLSSPELSHLSKQKLCPHETLPNPSASPWPHPLLPVSVDLTPLGTSSEWNQCVSFWVWFISLRIMSSRSNQVVAGVRISF